MRYIRSCIEVLSQAELERIHEASLEILQEVGVQVSNEELLGRLRAIGAQVHGDVARLPSDVVLRVLQGCVGHREDARADQAAAGRGPIRVTSGSETMVLEYPGHTLRPGMLDDVLKGIVVTNALPTVGRALPVVVPSDVPRPVAEVEAYRLGCLYSSKPFNVYFGLRACPYLMEMAAVVAEATEQAKRELGFEFSFGVVSPLRFAEDDLACAMMTAEQTWPTSCYSFVVLGASGPASMAGALALSNAERLACLTLMWLWGEVEGYQEGHVDDPCMIEPRTLATSFGHPNLTTLAIASNQLARFYGLEPGGGLALSDAKGIDFQSGYERGMGAVFSVLAGGSIGNSGIVGPDEAISLEQLVVDDAALSAVNWIMQGVEVSDESLALDVVKEVGIGGNYLDQVHTVEYLRQEYWESPIFTRQSWSGWERGGRKTLLERAHQEVERILAQGYPPEPLLPEGAARRLDEIVGRAWAELVA